MLSHNNIFTTLIQKFTTTIISFHSYIIVLATTRQKRYKMTSKVIRRFITVMSLAAFGSILVSERTILDPSHAITAQQEQQTMIDQAVVVDSTTNTNEADDMQGIRSTTEEAEPSSSSSNLRIRNTAGDESSPIAQPSSTTQNTAAEEVPISQPSSDQAKEGESSENLLVKKVHPDSVQGNFTRVLWGIMSVADSPKEIFRRKIIRKTYLTYYKDDKYKFYKDAKNYKSLICPLPYVLNGKAGPNDCQITYAFIMGGNPDGPTELMKGNSSYPIAIKEPTKVENVEHDGVYLNIKENMNEGKTQTWFKYATTIMDDENHHFDYVVKADTDTIVIPPNMFDFIERNLPPAPNNVRIYGGVPRNHAVQCIGQNGRHLEPENGDCDETINETYFNGELYWLSADLARHITSDDCNREYLSVPHEDMAIGNFVHSHPQPINMTMVWAPKAWGHAPHLKKPRDFRETWRRVFAGSLKKG